MILVLSLFFLWSEPGAAPEERALAYLAREVPRWSRENHCFSCHNNGDAARALYTAGRDATGALAETNRWLIRPEGWDHNGGEGGFSDKRLARVQFASALATAVEARAVTERPALLRAAARLAEDQAKDGSWPLEDGDALGSPATYGRALATFQAREALRAADPSRFRTAIENADRWLRRRPLANTPDVAAVLLDVADSDQADALARRRECREWLRRSQATEGGWGPYADSPPEPFDTAVALLALARQRDRDELAPLIARGRAYLIASQQADGSWVETTRPAGNVSYAQRLSTTGWATLALLATRPTAPRR